MRHQYDVQLQNICDTNDPWYALHVEPNTNILVTLTIVVDIDAPIVRRELNILLITCLLMIQMHDSLIQIRTDFAPITIHTHMFAS
jgi:hypothetical protein